MATCIDIIRAKIKDESGKLVDPDDYQSCLDEAFRRYSKNSPRPRIIISDVPGSGSYDCDLPDSWAVGFSNLVRLEYPIGRVPANIIDPRDYTIYSSPNGELLRILIARPDEDESVRVSFTVPHTEASCPAIDTDAVVNLAVSLCLRQLAAAYGQTSDFTMSADTVDYRSKSDEFRRLADSFERLYQSHMGIQANDTVVAAGTVAAPPDRPPRRPWRR